MVLWNIQRSPHDRFDRSDFHARQHVVHWARHSCPHCLGDEFRRRPDLLVHPEDVGGLIDLTAEAARTRGFATAEYRLLDRQGEVRWFRDECALVRDPSGTPMKNFFG